MPLCLMKDMDFLKILLFNCFNFKCTVQKLTSVTFTITRMNLLLFSMYIAQWRLNG